MKTLALLIFGTIVFLYSWHRLRKLYRIHIPEKNKMPDDYDLPYQMESIQTADGLTLSSWYIPIKNPKAVVILVHGYLPEGGGRPLMLDHAKYLYEAGYSVFMPALRSHGPSEGSEITFGVKEWMDVEASYDYMKSLPENKNKKIGFLGVSMGASTALVTAGKTNKGDFVIASVPYASFKNLYEFHLKREKKYSPLFLPFVLLAARLELGKNYDKLTPDCLVSNIKAPLFLMSALNDEKVNPSDAKYLYEKANEPKELWEVTSKHDMYESHPEEFKKRVLGFLSVLQS